MKKLLATLLLISAAVGANAGPRIDHWVAPSGARVYFVETRALPILDVQIDFAAGSAYSPPGKAGTAGFVASLLDNGAIVEGAELDEDRIAARWVDLGARFGGSTDNDRASATLRTLVDPAQRVPALALLAALLAKPTFPAAAVEREKGRAIAAIKEAETRPDAIAAKKFTKAIYPGHPYGIVSTVESVGAISRDDLEAFHRAHYGAKGAVVSIIGAVSRAEAEAIAEQLTAGLPNAGAPEPLPPVAIPERSTVRVPHPAAQSHILIGMPAIRRGDPDFYPLLVGNYILGGGGFVSRLMKEVREKRGYAYSVYSYFSPSKLEGPFQIGLQTKRDQAGAALGVVESVLGEFLAKGPTEKELAAAKKNLIDGMALRIDSNAKLLGYLSVIGFYGLPLTYLDDFPARVGAVTASDVRAAFARHVKPEHLVTVIVATD